MQPHHAALAQRRGALKPEFQGLLSTRAASSSLLPNPLRLSYNWSLGVSEDTTSKVQSPTSVSGIFITV